MLCDRSVSRDIPRRPAPSQTHSAAPTTQQTPKPSLFLRHSSLNTLSLSDNIISKSHTCCSGRHPAAAAHTHVQHSTEHHTSTQLPTTPMPPSQSTSYTCRRRLQRRRQQPCSTWWYCDGSSCCVAVGWVNHSMNQSVNQSINQSPQLDDAC